MKFRLQRTSLFLLSTLALSGCATAIPHITTTTPGFTSCSQSTLETLAIGRREYIAKCSGCHSLYRPSQGDGGYWTSWMAKMSKRSRLSELEQERIRAYLVAAAGPLPSGAADTSSESSFHVVALPLR